MSYSKLYSRFINKCYLILIFAFQFAVTGNAQTFRAQFDRMDQGEGLSGWPLLLGSNMGTTLTARGGRLLESYILMYKATKDIKYLNEFIIISKRIMDRRDDNWSNIYTQVPPFVHNAGSGCTITETSPQLHSSTEKGWSSVDGEVAECVLHSSFKENGEVVCPMARFILLIQSEPTLNGLPVPIEANSFSGTLNSYNSLSIINFGDYSNWLSYKVQETLDWEIDNHYYDDSDFLDYNLFHDYSGTDGYVAYNQQSDIARSLLIMYLATGNMDYLSKANNIGEYVLEGLDENTHLLVEYTLTNGDPWNSWRHSPDAEEPEPSIGDPTPPPHKDLYEDISHAWLEAELVELRLENGFMTDNSYIQKIANGFYNVMCKSPAFIWPNVYGTNIKCNQACWPEFPNPSAYVYNGGHYVFLSKYQSGIYQTISDIFSPNQSINFQVNGIFGGLNGNTAVDMLGLAQLVYYQQFLDPTHPTYKHLFNPITVKPGTPFGYVGDYPTKRFGAASGNFGNSGNQFALLNNTLTNSNITTYTIDNNNNINEYVNANFASTDLTYLAAGNVNNGFIGDELVSVDLASNELCIYHKSGATIYEAFQKTIVASNVAGIAVGEFAIGHVGKEILIATKDGNINMYVLNNSTFQIDFWPLATYSTGCSTLAGITSGDFNGDGVDDFAVIDSDLGTIKVFDINMDVYLAQTATFSSGITSNDWNGITAGDFDGDGIDEILIHKGLTNVKSIMQVYNQTGSSVVFKWEEIFHSSAGNGSMCTMKIPAFPLSDVIVTQRRYDDQISIFNLDGLCPNLYLNNQTISSITSLDHPFYPGDLNNYPIDYHVNNIILAGNEYEIASDGKVEMIAGKAVIFTPGFTASLGSDLHAYIDPGIACTTPTFRKATPPAQPPITFTSPSATINNLSIAPNPNNGNFKIDFTLSEPPEKLKLTVTNSMGQLISSQDIYNGDGSIKSAEVNLTGQPNGIYIVTLSGTNFMQSKRFTIVNNE